MFLLPHSCCSSLNSPLWPIRLLSALTATTETIADGLAPIRISEVTFDNRSTGAASTFIPKSSPSRVLHLRRTYSAPKCIRHAGGSQNLPTRLFLQCSAASNGERRGYFGNLRPVHSIPDRSNIPTLACGPLITAAQNVHRTNEPVAISPHARCGTLSSAIETFWRWECSRASNSRPLWLNFQRQAVALEFQDRAAADPCAYIRWSCR